MGGVERALRTIARWEKHLDSLEPETVGDAVDLDMSREDLEHLREMVAHSPAKVPDGWQVHAKVNVPDPDNVGQRIVGYRVTLPDSAGLSGVCDYLPSLTTPHLPPHRRSSEHE